MKNFQIKMAASILAMGLTNAFAICDGAGVLNTDVWFNGDNQQVNTGADGMYEYEECETTSMGYWLDINDSTSGGLSHIWYPYDTAGYYGSYIAPMIAELGYLKEPGRCLQG